ncbi:MAG: EAL domain-containing protein [Candidatus Velthaea sp.]
MKRTSPCPAAPDDAPLLFDLSVGGLDILFTKHPRPMWIFDLETLRFTAVNDAALQLYGYDRAAFLRMRLKDIRTTHEYDDLYTAVGAMRDGGASRRTGPIRHRRADGTEVTVRIESTHVACAGRPARLVMVADLTDQLAAERALHEREAQLRLFIDQLPALMWTTDESLRFTSVAGAALAKIGLAPGTGVGDHIETVFVGGTDARPSDVPPAHAAALLGNRVKFEGWWRDRFFHSVVEPLYNDREEIVGTIGVALDITERRHDAEQLERRTEELHAAQAIAHFGSWSRDLRTNEVAWTPELYRIVGETPTDPALDLNLFTFDHPEDTEAVRAAIAASEERREPFDIEHRMVRKNGEVRWVREQGAFDFDGAGRAVRCVGTVLDITERKNAEDRLAYLAHHDPLTDLPNRTLLQERLTRAVLHAERRNTSAAALFIDLDRFKYINDTFGHVVGDELLARVAQRLARILRSSDTVARPGGDEFVIVLEDLDDAERASDLSQRILREFSKPFNLSVGAHFIGASIGIALYPVDGLTPNDLLRAADSAMYRAKERGGNDFQFFTPQLHESAMLQLELGNALRVAVERRDVYVVYQPIQQSTDGRIVCVEALARWNRGDAPPVGPAEFVQIAEETGMIRELGESILRQACTQMAAWIAAGVPLEAMAVNISTRQLSERGFVSRVAEILLATQLAPDRLELEITETAFVDGNDRAVAAIEQLRQIGVRFAIDDFGTGYSSLAYLKRIPADTVKIDRSFIMDLEAKTDRAIVEAVIMVARVLGKRVVAEGVETIEQLAVLRHLECDCAQGFYFSKPVDARTAERLIRAAALAAAAPV